MTDHDGTFRVVPAGASTGVFRSGRWSGSPYVRLTYKITADGKQAAQNLPWLPDQTFFQIAFEIVAGVKYDAFLQETDGMDRAARSAAFRERFMAAEYDAEIRVNGQYLNVLRVIARHDPSPPSLAAQLGDIAQQLGMSDEQFSEVCYEEFGLKAEEMDESTQQALLEYLREQLLYGSEDSAS